jgi:hypothetical protein
MPTIKKVFAILRDPQRLVSLMNRYLSQIRLAVRNRLSSSPITSDGGPVVCLTSYGRRVTIAYLPIESIAAGALLPSRLILWIDDLNLISSLPSSLIRLQKRGLEIRSCPNYGPHKKYYSYVEAEESFVAPLVTADDDVFYPPYWLKRLSDAYESHPENVSCFWARRVGIDSAQLSPFCEWPMCAGTKPSLANQAIGASGIIYPPSFLTVLKREGSAFLTRCPSADDLWLHVQAVRAGFPVRQIGEHPLILHSVPNSEKTSLWRRNAAGGNDAQARATYHRSDIALIRGEGMC